MNRIKKLREEFGYTQQDLANKLNGSKSVIGLYENEMRKPSLEILVKLSEIFDCSIDYILCKKSIENFRKSDIIIITMYDVVCRWAYTYVVNNYFPNLYNPYN